MRNISITVTKDGKKHIKTSPHAIKHIHDGISIDFFFEGNLHEKEMMYTINDFIKTQDWFVVEQNNYYLNLKLLAQEYTELFLDASQWMIGVVRLEPESDNAIHTEMKIINFSITKEEISDNAPKKIFLSHKGANKDKVKNFYILLKELGFDPWIDEEDMQAGSKLYRSILKGFKESCAVVFFITPEFKDEEYLENEIDYAIKQKLEKKQKFSIITLQFENDNGEKGMVPELLQDYVWKKPQSELEAFREILRSLPIKVGTTHWK